MPNTALARTTHGQDSSGALDSAALFGVSTQTSGQMQGQTPGVKLRSFGQSLRRRAWLVVLTLALLNGLAVFGVSQLRPRYTAEAALIVDPREEQVVDLKAVLSGLGGDSDVVESEIQVLRSRGIVRGIVENYHLDRLPEFNPALRPPGLLAAAKAFAWQQYTVLLALTRLHHADDAERWAQQAAGAGAAAGPPLGGFGAIPLATPNDPLSVPINTFLERLDVAAKGRSRVVGVSFTSESPPLAAGLANAVVDAYIASQLKAKMDATSQAHQWLDLRVTELRQQMMNADTAVAEYRRKNGLTRGREASLSTEQISELGTEVMRSQEAVAVAQGRLAAVAGINPNAMGLKQALAAAEGEERRLTTNLDTLRQQVSVGNESEIELRALQQEADAYRALYDRLLARAKETQIQSGLQQPDAKVVSRAERPQEPSFPKPMLILPAMFVASCLVAVLLVLAVEGLDRGFTTVEQLEETLGFPAIGLMPMLGRRARRRRAPGHRGGPGCHVLDEPHGPFAQAIRSVHTSLMLSGHGHAPRIVMVASALPEEGKSVLSLSLARLMASCGRRVAIVDCDLRRPTLHKAFEAQRGPGLVDYLLGEATLDDVLRTDPLSGAQLVAAGTAGTLAPDLFASDRMRTLLALLSERFDLVLLDCAPVLAVSETRHLCRLADETVFVVRWRRTRGDAAEVALRQLVSAGGRIGGLLLSMVDMNKYGRYSRAGVVQRRISLYLGH